MKEKMHELLFVGVTRAVRWVYLSSAHEQMISPLKQMYYKVLREEEVEMAIRHGQIMRQLTFKEKMSDKFDFGRKKQCIQMGCENSVNMYSDII
jgi:hypothetical protein